MPMPGDFDYRILDVTSHRPWPMPGRPWVMTQTWHNLLFAHWAVDPPLIRAHVPLGLDLDLFDGRAWVGVVPFHMTNVAPRAVPALPGLSAFPELNVRTYVRVDNKPGVYFFSLDATNPAAVAAARMLGLPYFVASMAVSRVEREIHYQSKRRVGHTAEMRARYEPLGPPFEAATGSVDYFFTERYCLYTANRRGRLRRLDIHHPPWHLQRAAAVFDVNTMGRQCGLELASPPGYLHFARRQDTVAWMPVTL
jgi:uncharacterized protein